MIDPAFSSTNHSQDHDRILLFYGDSITAEHREHDEDGLGQGFVRLIADHLAANASDAAQASVCVLNRGVAHDGVQQIAARFERDVLPEQPDVLTVLVGINDVRRAARSDAGYLDIDAFDAHLTALCERIRSETPLARLVLMTPFLLDVDEQIHALRPDMERAADVVRRLARRERAVLVDLARAMDEAVLNTVPPAELAADGIHPTPTGHHLIADWLRTVDGASDGPAEEPADAAPSCARAQLVISTDPAATPRADDDHVVVARSGTQHEHLPSGVFRIPALARLDDHSLIAVFDARPTLTDLPGPIDVVYAISRDRGATWSDIRILRTTDDGTGVRGFGDPCVIVDGDLLHVLYAESDAVGFWDSRSGDDDTDPHLLRTSSSTARIADLLAEDPEHRAAWTHRTHTRTVRTSARETLARQNIDGDVAGLFVASGHGIALHEGSTAPGRLLTGAVARIDGQIRVAVLASDDRGQTWRMTCVMPPGGDESAIAQRPDGTVVLHARARGCRLQALSTDGGESFSPWEPIDALMDPSCNGDLLALGDTLVVSHCADPEVRRNVAITCSDDGGQTWTRQLVIDDGSAAYSALVDLSPHTAQAAAPSGEGPQTDTDRPQDLREIGVLWEADGYRELRFRRVRLQDVDQPILVLLPDPSAATQTSESASGLAMRETVTAQGQTQNETETRIDLTLRQVAQAATPAHPSELPASRDPRDHPGAAGLLSMMPGNEHSFARENLQASLGPARTGMQAGDAVTVDVRVCTERPVRVRVQAAGRPITERSLVAGRHLLHVPILVTDRDLCADPNALTITAQVLPE